MFSFIQVSCLEMKMAIATDCRKFNIRKLPPLPQIKKNKIKGEFAAKFVRAFWANLDTVHFTRPPSIVHDTSPFYSINIHCT